ncbi:MAG: hypothetical protein ACOC4G_12540 [Bacillota bacterium]
MKNILLIFLFLSVLTLTGGISQGYSPEITGNLETGDRFYTELVEEEEEEILDFYQYSKVWLRYKQQLAPYEYYYIKTQYYKKDYQDKDNYNNITLDLWTNYTFYLKPEVRNRWNFDIKDKNYYLNQDKSYQAFKIKSQFDYKYNDLHNYTLYLQRQWNEYKKNKTKDNIKDRISFDWKYKINSSLELKTNISMDQQKYGILAESSNKYGKKMSLNFKYKP